MGNDSEAEQANQALRRAGVHWLVDRGRDATRARTEALRARARGKVRDGDPRKGVRFSFGGYMTNLDADEWPYFELMTCSVCSALRSSYADDPCAVCRRTARSCSDLGRAILGFCRRADVADLVNAVYSCLDKPEAYQEIEDRVAAVNALDRLAALALGNDAVVTHEIEALRRRVSSSDAAYEDLNTLCKAQIVRAEKAEAKLESLKRMCDATVALLTTPDAP